MKNSSPLEPGLFYHIYNRGNNREDLFREQRNYSYFLKLYKKYITPIADTYAYCLLQNHFHFLLRIKDEKEVETVIHQEDMKGRFPPNKYYFAPSKSFSNMFNAYSKAINKSYDRKGSLFEKNFHRIAVTEDVYLLELIFYIHFNPQKHGLIGDYTNWRWSSYQALIGKEKTNLVRDEIIELFGNQLAFIEFHRDMAEHRKLLKINNDDNSDLSDLTDLAGF